MNEIVPHLFRTEFRKIVAVISRLYGLEHIEIAEDITSETFLLAAETWGKKGIPENPTAWLYTVAKNKAKDHLRRNQLFKEKVADQLKHESNDETTMEVDISSDNIKDSELRMMFAVCHPAIPVESQIGLSLRILFGLGIEEIADAFLSNKETINKRLFRAKEKLREIKIELEMPSDSELDNHLKSVVSTIYLLFNEGYYSASQNSTLRKDICLQALQLAYLLTENPTTNQPYVCAVVALFCFHASRFDARQRDGEILLMDEQDSSLWNRELISIGELYLNKAAVGKSFSKYHLEAAIAYWHTQPTDSVDKWRQILDYYNVLLQIEYSPVAALNRTYALYKVEGAEKAIKEALKLNLENNHLYYALLGHLYTDIQNTTALEYLGKSLAIAKTENDKKVITEKMNKLKA
jgi:RNA polymerase sigma factor (sigma-70 family)